MPVDTIAEAPSPALSGVARVLVHGGKLSAKAAEDLVVAAKEKRQSFVEALLASGAMSPNALAHALSAALSVPLLDLDAVELPRLPVALIDAKLVAQYKIVPLGRRGSRLFLACSDPTDQDRKSTRLNSSHSQQSRMPSSA